MTLEEMKKVADVARGLSSELCEGTAPPLVRYMWTNGQNRCALAEVAVRAWGGDPRTGGQRLADLGGAEGFLVADENNNDAGQDGLPWALLALADRFHPAEVT